MISLIIGSMLVRSKVVRLKKYTGKISAVQNTSRRNMADCGSNPFQSQRFPETSSPQMRKSGIQNLPKEFGNKSPKQEIDEREHNIKDFKYTNDYNMLSKDQRLFYEENGFIVLPNLVPSDTLEVYKQRFRDICESKVQVSGLTIMKDVVFSKERPSERVINKIQDFMLDDVLFGYCKLPQILEYVKCFCGPNIKAMHTMLINKPPDTGTRTSRHPLHQDLIYFHFRPADKVVCSWTAMENVNRANGCLAAIPGSHKGELLEHGYPDWKGGVNKAYYGILDLKENELSKREHLEIEAGDTIFFHPLLIHGSGANKTDGFRKAISCHYAAADCHFTNVVGTNQEHFAQESLEAARKKGVLVNNVKDFWQMRSRLVCGNEPTL